MSEDLPPIRIVRLSSNVYQAMFGENPAGQLIVNLLGYRRRDLPRYRDAFVTVLPNREVLIGVYLRSAESGKWQELKRNPLYVGHENDSLDSTYLTVYFNPPEDEELKEMLRRMETPVEKRPGPERWKNAFKAMQEGTFEMAHPEVIVEMAEKFREFMEDPHDQPAE